MIRALLFDFDGVIVDTEVPTYESWRAVYAEHGADLPLATYLPAVGTGSSTSSTDGGFDAIANLEALIGKTLDRRLEQADLVLGSLAELRLEDLLQATETRNA